MKTLSSVFVHCLIYITANTLECPPIQVDDFSSHSDLVSQLTDPCRYDLLVRPIVPKGGPLIVRAKMYIYYLQMTHSTNLQFKVQMLVQFHWQDKRLSYKNITNMTELVGQKSVLEKVWFPHIYLSNEEKSSVMGLSDSDQVISITPQGDVMFSTRLYTSLICQTEEGKFPFDLQTCHLVMDNWRYNLSYVVLQWEDPQPVAVREAMSSLTEFDMTNLDTATSDDLMEKSHNFIISTGITKSSLIVIFQFARKSSFYFWDYYVPSLLLVVTSWGTFWVDPEVVPCRVWLATCTMLGFFGLGAMNDAMPKLSHLKMNDIWFIGCNLFIFLSLAEFAFVNIVHRQETKHIPLKRVSSKYILKSSLMSERVAWKTKSSSCPSSPELRQQRKSALAARRTQQTSRVRRDNAYDRVRGVTPQLYKKLKNILAEPRPTENNSAPARSHFRPQEIISQPKSVAFDLALEDLTSDVRMRRQLSRRRQAFAGTHMTNHEMANWIDQRSRLIFPLAFLVFNVLFWSLMFI